MSNLVKLWLQLLLAGVLLIGAAGARCADTLRDVSDELDDLANVIGGEEEEDFDDILDDISDWFD